MESGGSSGNEGEDEGKIVNEESILFYLFFGYYESGDLDQGFPYCRGKAVMGRMGKAVSGYIGYYRVFFVLVKKKDRAKLVLYS